MNSFSSNDLSEILTKSLKCVKNVKIMRISKPEPFSCLDRFGNGMGSTVNGTSDFDNSVFTNDHRVSNPIWPPEIVHAHYVSSISLFVLFGLVSIGKCILQPKKLFRKLYGSYKNFRSFRGILPKWMENPK